MTDFLLEILSEEIPARMQAKARADLARLFAEQLSTAGLTAEAVETYSTPRRLALIARNLPAETAAVSEEIKGPRASAPPQALEGFLRKTGLTRDQLTDRDGILFAIIDKPGRATSAVLAEAIPAIVRAFPWPKSMRWGEASIAAESLRWVRPLQGIVALLGEEIVEFEIAGVKSGAATVGHRFHHPGVITIGSAADYAAKLGACHVIVDQAERARLIRDGAEEAARAAGLALVPDDGLIEENAGLTEWPVPLLGGFDPAFLEVPPEVIQLTMRTNQKYFAARDGEGALAPNFICVANIEASDGGSRVVAGNQRVLSARLSDAKFFWEQDLKVPLTTQAEKLSQIVFHEKLGTLADKVDRVAKLARWLVEEGIVGGSNPAPATTTRHPRESGDPASSSLNAADQAKLGSRFRGNDEERAALADQAETAARLAKADLVTGLVGEFPELQGIIGGHLARAQGQPPAIADAIRDHYKPAGQGDEVPTAPVTAAVSLADKLYTIAAFFAVGLRPSGSKDPFALRRAAIGLLATVIDCSIRMNWLHLLDQTVRSLGSVFDDSLFIDGMIDQVAKAEQERGPYALWERFDTTFPGIIPVDAFPPSDPRADFSVISQAKLSELIPELWTFFVDRLKVQQREAGVRHDLIDAVFALGAEDDLVRLLARVKALQSFVETPEGADLLAGYKRAANILKKEGWAIGVIPAKAGTQEHGVDPSDASFQAPKEMGPGLRRDDSPENPLSYTPENEEAALIAALDSAEPQARAAVQGEDFEGAMAALASLRAPVDAFFDKVTVNDSDPARRAARLDLLARMRDAVHQVADFSKIEG